MWPTDLTVMLEPRRALQHRRQTRTIEIGNADEVFPLHAIHQ